MIPLSTENTSAGNPAMFQDLIRTGSPSISRSWKSWLQIICKSVHNCTHSLICCTRNGIVNGPK